MQSLIDCCNLLFISQQKILRKEIRYDLFSGFLAGHNEIEELPVDFNEKLFHRLVDYKAVYPDGRVVFTFRNGAEVSTNI